jgi:septal ring factor EnvC (AmiA/AmiB activator)
MTLEIKKFKAELMRVHAARAEMEYRIAQCEDEINRLRDHIQKQEEAEANLQAKLKELGADNGRL